MGFFPSDYWPGIRMEQFAKQVNDRLWKYSLSGVQPIQFAIYSPGDRFDWHHDFLDAGSEDGAPIAWHNQFRVITVVVALSPPSDYTGGEFMIAPDASQDALGRVQEGLQLPRGFAVAFPSTCLHQVRPVLSGTRMTLTAWLLGPHPGTTLLRR